jgi:hypothetical protein
MNTDKSKKIIIIVIAIVAAISALCSIAAAVLVGIFVVGSVTTKPEVYTDITNYREYMSFDVTDADSQWNKWGIDESIWPQEITDNMTIADYKMVYYNPWDAQYILYMTIKYDDSSYETEMDRLEKIGVEDYKGIYSVTDEPSGYDLVAMDSDSYNGFVYAMVPEDEDGSITYVMIYFCNYFLDLDIHEYMPDELLLQGFNAADDNPDQLAFQERAKKKDQDS